MEAVPEETRAKDCVVDPGSGKTLAGEQETTGLVENFARVSENREEGSSGGLGTASDEKMKGDVNETKRSSGNGVGVKNVDDSGVMEDSEMNGVSSLLKMKQDFGEFEKENNTSSSNARDVVKELSLHGEEEEEEEEIDGEEEEEHGFRVGDFVWGKIKSHPWWPGQIYDSSDASDLALKIKQKGRLLVAYFGDGTFAWCHPSQLKPFVENFREFSRGSSSRVFVIAVEEAVEEMGRHVECMVTCGCVGKECLNDGLIRPAANAGIKEGVLVPEIRRESFSCLEFEPEAILRDAKAFAKTVSLSDLLEFEALKRKISAFFRSKGGYRLAEYHEPRPIQGLKDKNVEQAVKLPGSKGSVGEDGLKPEESDLRSLEKCSGFPENRLHHRRKQKSIAEILETDTNNRAKIEEEAAKGSAVAGRKKRERSDEVKGDAGKTSNNATSIARRRRVSEVSADATGSQQKQEKPLSRKRKKRGLDVDNDGSGKTDEATLSEEIEKKKTLDSENDVDSTPLASLRKKIKIDVSSVEKDGSKGCETKVQTPNDSLSRERKRSKYLSPPYTTEFSSKGKRSEIEAESMKVSSQAHVGEQMNTAAGNIIIMATDKETPADKHGDAADDDTGHQEATNELRKAAEFLRLGAPPDELKDLIRTTALSPQYAKDDCSGDLIREFVSIYRGFTYHEGANSKIPWKQDLDIEKEKEAGKSRRQREGKSEKRPKSKENSAETKKQVLSASPKSRNERRKKKKLNEASAPEPSEPKKTLTEIEYVKEKLEEMKSMVDKSEGTMTEELKMKLENEMRNLLKKVSKMAVLSS